MEFDDLIEHYRGEALIADPVIELKSGKEASVWLCTAGLKVREARARRTRIDGEAHGPDGPHPEPAGATHVALKIFKDVDKRSFRGAANYFDGRLGTAIRKRRDILHLQASPEAMQSAWVDAEWSALNLLKDARLPVPAPYARTAGSIAMEFVPSARGSAEPAPRLRDVELSPDQAREALDTLLGFVQETLARDMIHGDLSPFNVLWSDGAPVVIDFPQFVDARNHSRAYEMLVRDVRNVCEHLERFGARPPESASAFADRLWRRFERNDLYPGDWERERAALAV